MADLAGTAPRPTSASRASSRSIAAVNMSAFSRLRALAAEPAAADRFVVRACPAWRSRHLSRNDRAWASVFSTCFREAAWSVLPAVASSTARSADVNSSRTRSRSGTLDDFAMMM
ncbi:MAG: hypothetical protein LW698_12200 [Planctomycetaceae bacterium]|nr:hypothetical protein [Planctomycetaceae bacterium]